MLTERDIALAIEALAAIPYFPREAGARAAIGRALEEGVPDALTLERVTDRAVRHMSEWKGVPAMIDGDEEGAALYGRIAESDRARLLPPPPPEPLSDEERSENARLQARVTAIAKGKGFRKLAEENNAEYLAWQRRHEPKVGV